MRSTEVPEEDLIVRYVKPTMVHEDGSVDAMEFVLRERDVEDGFSVNWLGAFAGNPSAQLKEVVQVCRYTVRRNGRFAECSVRDLRLCLARQGATSRVLHAALAADETQPADPSRAVVQGLPKSGTDKAVEVGAAIASMVTVRFPPI